MLDPLDHSLDIHEQDRFVRRLAARLVGPGEAADLAQEAWRVALSRPRPSEAHPAAWLTGIVKRLALATRRQSARSVAATLDPNLHETESTTQPQDVVARTELEQRLISAVLALPEPRRTIVLLHIREEETSIAIGRKLNLPDGTVRWHLKSALDDLRARLDKEHQGNRRAWLAPVTALARSPWNRTEPYSALHEEVLSMKFKVTAFATVAASALISCAFLLQSEAPSAPPSAPNTQPKVVAAPNPVLPDRASTESSENLTPRKSDGKTLSSHRFRVRGKAVDLAGEPLPAVEIASRPLARSLQPRAAAFTSRTQSSANGSFEFDLDLEVDPSDPTRVVEHEVQARRTGFLPAFRSTLSPAIGFRDVIELGNIALAEGKRLNGSVVDENGKGIAGVVVHAVTDEVDASIHEFGVDEQDTWPTTTTNSTGEFEFSEISQPWVTVVADAPQYVVSWAPRISLADPRDTPSVRVKLTGLGNRVIEGDCLDAQGNPIPNASLSMQWRVGRATLSKTLRADASGHYRIRALDDVPRSITLSHGGLAVSLSDVRPGNRSANLDLRNSMVARIHVLDATTKLPIRDLTVGVNLVGGNVLSPNDLPRIDSNSPGDVLFNISGAGELTILLSAPGYGEASAGPFTKDTTPLVSTVEIEPSPFGTPEPRRMLHVLVRSASGPIAGAHVDLSEASLLDFRGIRVRCPDSLPTGQIKTDEKGRAGIDIQHTEPMFDDAFVIRSIAESFAPGESRVFDLSDPSIGTATEPLIIELAQPGSIQGKVRTRPEDKRNVAGWVVAAWREFGIPRLTRASADGSFRFDGLTPGPWHVETRPFEFDFREIGSWSIASEPTDSNPNVTVNAGQTVEFDCLAEDAMPTRLQGKLFADSGHRVGWTVRLDRVERSAVEKDFADGSYEPSMQGQKGAAAAVHPDGTFELTVHSAGDYLVTATDTSLPDGSGSSIAQLVTLKSGSNTLALGLRFGRIEGTIELPSSLASEAQSAESGVALPIRWHSLRAVDRFAYGVSRCGPSGNFLIESVPEGEIEIDLLRSNEVVRVMAGETTILSKR